MSFFGFGFFDHAFSSGIPDIYWSFARFFVIRKNGAA
jgi:hypothetical protein